MSLSDADILRMWGGPIHPNNKERMLEFARRILFEAQSRAEPTYTLFGYWDHFNEVLYRGDDAGTAAATSAEEGGNKITPLYAAPQKTAAAPEQLSEPHPPCTGGAEPALSAATPETDAAWNNAPLEDVTAMLVIARKLEIQRNEARAALERTNNNSMRILHECPYCHQHQGGGVTPCVLHGGAASMKVEKLADGMFAFRCPACGVESGEIRELRAALEAERKTRKNYLEVVNAADGWLTAYEVEVRDPSETAPCKRLVAAVDAIRAEARVRELEGELTVRRDADMRESK